MTVQVQPILASPKLIDSFLEGKDGINLERITYISTSPYNNKVILKQSLKDGSKKYLTSENGDIPSLIPYLYLKKSVYDKIDYSEFEKRCMQFSINMEHLITSFDGNCTNERLLNGYNIKLSSTKKTIVQLKDFLKDCFGIQPYEKDENGNDVFYNEDNEKLRINADGSISILNDFGFEKKLIVADKAHTVEKRQRRTTDYVCLSSDEQYMIQNELKMFKGVETVKDLHNAVIDIETNAKLEFKDVDKAALSYDKGYIIQIAISDNRGFRKVLNNFDGADSKRELEIIEETFKIILEQDFDNVAYHYGEFFDMWFILGRASRLNYSLEDIQTDVESWYRVNKNIKLYSKQAFNRRSTMLKVGGETESKMQTSFFGKNMLDTIDATKRAAVLDRKIPSNKLKEIVRYLEKEKKNRVYIEGDSIGSLYVDKRPYAWNKSNGEYYLLEDSKTEQIKEGYELVRGFEIVVQYLIDDLDETMEVFNYYFEAPFLLNKWLPIGFESACVMGGASTWIKLYYAWAYKYKLAVPLGDTKRKYLGGLVGMLKSGWLGSGGKLDFRSLYPSLFLEYGLTLEHDISNFFKTFLKYSCDNRNKYKLLRNIAKKEGRKEAESKWKMIEQPFKINNNAFYGSLAFFMNNLSHIDSAELITVLGRASDRILYKFFRDRGVTIIYCHTDSIHFVYTDKFNHDFEYVGLGKNDMVEKGKLYKGLQAYVHQFNDEYMVGYMGLDIDEEYECVVQLSKANYFSRENGKIKTIGATAKTKTKSPYIGDFIDAIKPMLLDRDGESIRKLYLETIHKILDGKVKRKDIMGFKKINMEQEFYETTYIYDTDSSGKLNSRMAHHELVKQEKLRVGLGQRIYYMNVGNKKTDGNVQVKKEKLGTYKCTKREAKRLKDLLTKKFLEKKLSIQKDILDLGLVYPKKLAVKNNYMNELFSTDFNSIDEMVNAIVDNPYFIVKGKNKRLIVENTIIKGGEVETKLKTKISITDEGFEKGFIELIHSIEKWSAINLEYNEELGLLEIGYSHFKMNVVLVDDKDMELVGGYNIEKYVDKFNSALEAFLVVFHPNTRKRFFIESMQQYHNDKVLELDLEYCDDIPYKDYSQITEQVLLSPIKGERDFFRKIGMSPYYIEDGIKWENDDELVTYNGKEYKGHELVDVILAEHPINILKYGFIYYNKGYLIQHKDYALHWGYMDEIKLYNKKTKELQKVKFKYLKNPNTDTIILKDYNKFKIHPLPNAMHRMLELIWRLFPELFKKLIPIYEQDLIDSFGEY